MKTRDFLFVCLAMLPSVCPAEDESPKPVARWKPATEAEPSDETKPQKLSEPAAEPKPAESSKAEPSEYGWEKELQWKIRVNRGPEDASGDLGTAVRLLEGGRAGGDGVDLYSAAYRTLVARPDRTFADLSRNEDFLEMCAGREMKLLGGPMLGAVHSHGASIWVRTVEPAEIVAEVEGEGKTRKFGPVKSTFESDLSAVIAVEGLRPGTRYEYRLKVDGAPVSLPAETELMTTPPEQARTRMRIAFGGDFHRWGFAHKPLFDRILSRKPVAMVLVGDLAVQDRFTHLGLHRADYLLRDFFPDWRRLACSIPLYATWDDHDYLENDLGGIPPHVNRKQQAGVWEVFRRSWNNPAYGFDDDRRGVFFRTRIGVADLIMVDNKFFRSDGGKGKEKERTLLGHDQMKWLREQLLACEGPFVILSCGTMWTDHVSKGKDSWGKFAPEDREALFALLDENSPGRVLLISGDRHGACGYRIPRPGGRDLYEFNVGCLGGISGDQAPASKAPDADGDRLYRFGEGYAFGEFEFDTVSDPARVTFRLIADSGEVVHAMVVP